MIDELRRAEILANPEQVTSRHTPFGSHRAKAARPGRRMYSNRLPRCQAIGINSHLTGPRVRRKVASPGRVGRETRTDLPAVYPLASHRAIGVPPRRERRG